MAAREVLDPDRTTIRRTRAGSSVADHLSRVADLLREVDSEAVASLVYALEAARGAGRTVFTLGNGGSAATALHLANDLAATARPGRPPLKVVCLNANVSLFSCLANDFGYDQVFVRQLAPLLAPEDVVFGISASGDSENCVNALSFARRRGAVTAGLLGFDGGRMKALCDHAVHVPCNDYLSVEDVHLAVCHALARALRDGL
ncbi:MAG TPA: SIS domain-containing protein [Thermoanaerobaculia bacterium]|nr:SIS domain-containing protein [Thermoanaerobaculia bacterium]